MAHVWFVELSYNDDELNFLEKLGLRQKQVRSWRYTNRSTIGFMDVIKRASLMPATSENIVQTIVSDISIAQTNTSIQTLEEYFGLFTHKILAKIGIDDFYPPDTPDIIAINLVPFFFRAADASRIARGIATLMSTSAHLAATTLVIFTKQHSLFSDLHVLKELAQLEKGPFRISIIDFEGSLITYEQNKKAENGEPRKTIKKLNPRGAIEKILIHDENSLRNALIYDTNINVGHFEVGSCHVRTHYDLEDFVKYDNVLESLYNRFCTHLKSYKKIVIFSTGLEDEALKVLGNSFQYRNGIDLNHGSNYPPHILWKAHFNPDNLLENSAIIKKWCQGADCVAVLSDVINSGETVLNFTKNIKELLSDSGSTTEIKGAKNQVPHVTPFSVVKMINSPKDLYACVQIRRPYLSKTPSECPLCLLKQPLTKVRTHSWKRDFRHVHTSQLTSLDFWEMANDCKALIRERSYPSGEILLHRIDTQKMMNRYGKWLINLISEKYKTTWGDDNWPDFLITVQESAGEKFASLVKQACGKNNTEILSIPRDFLKADSEIPSSLSEKLNNAFDTNANVFLVDDGINKGGTMTNLFNFSHKYQLNIVGGLVLDSRLTPEKMHDLFSGPYKPNILALYTWPSIAFPAIS